MNIERKEFVFENDFVKLKKPTKEQEKEIIDLIKDNGLDLKDGIETAYYILKKLCVPKMYGYDFNEYSLEEFKNMVEEAHYYDCLHEILNEVYLIGSQITIHELQYIVMGLRQEKINALLKIIKEESEGLGELSKEISLAEKENKKMKKLASEYKKNAKIKKEVELMSLENGWEQ